MRAYYQVGLQQFKFCLKYDCIWTNWTLCYLDDGDVLKFLKQAALNLRKVKEGKIWKTGLIIIKENIEKDKSGFFFEEQNQRVRTKATYEQIFLEAGLQIVDFSVQNLTKYREEMYPIAMWVLKPAQIRDWQQMLNE